MRLLAFGASNEPRAGAGGAPWPTRARAGVLLGDGRRIGEQGPLVRGAGLSPVAGGAGIHQGEVGWGISGPSAPAPLRSHPSGGGAAGCGIGTPRGMERTGSDARNHAVRIWQRDTSGTRAHERVRRDQGRGVFALLDDGARGGSRTHTPFRTEVFETSASAIPPPGQVSGRARACGVRIIASEPAARAGSRCRSAC